MKKLLLSISIMTLVFSTSCKKPIAAGSWTFENVTYPGVSCIATANMAPELTAETSATYGSPPGASAIGVQFLGALPVSSGTYVVAPGYAPTASNQVTLAFAAPNGDSYQATGGNGSNQTVTLTFSGDKMSISGSGIEMLNHYAPFDSSGITFDIHQQ